MRDLEKILHITREIEDVREKLKETELRISSPKNQIMTGMPRGGNNENKIDEYLIKSEMLTLKLQKLSNKRNNLWNQISVKFENANITSEAIALMWSRFYEGIAWKACSDIMQAQRPNENWNINKCFRVYSAILYKIDKL